MKPEIICHIMSSVDGRLLNGRWTLPYDGKTPSEIGGIYAEIGKTLKTQAWLFGRNTLQELYFPQVFDHTGSPTARNPETWFGNRSSERLFVVADPTGEITYTADTVRGCNIVAILGEKVSERYLEHLRKWGISYLFAGEKGEDLPLAMHRLRHEFEIESLTVQGGGQIDGAFLKAGLLDELSLLIYPGIDGLSGIPSVFEYTGTPGELPAEGQSLELLSVEQFTGGVIRLHYKFHHKYNLINN